MIKTAEQEYVTFKQMSGNRFNIYQGAFLKEKVMKADMHYLYHPAWAARVLAKTKPERHVDISSYIFFNALVSAFIPIDFYDYHIWHINLDGLQSLQADLVNLDFDDGSILSLSCMHVVEHIGLGRYYEPLNPRGDLEAIAELKRVLAPQGNLLFVVPVGIPKIIFNLHRIYSYDQIISYFPELELVEFVLISDATGGFVKKNAAELADKQDYGCGCFWFRKD